MPTNREPQNSPRVGREVSASHLETRVLLIRHGKTSDSGRFHGAESDVGLSERGVRQAQLLARHFDGLPLASVYSSRMRRALETADPIASACGLELNTIPALHKCRLGALSGRTKQEGETDYAELTRRWAAGEVHFNWSFAKSV